MAKRNTQTKDLIKQSLLILIDEKSISSISVIELCKKAGINRSTFYLHYQDIKGVILEMEAEFLTQIEVYIRATSSTSNENTYNAVFHVLEYLKANKDLAKALINNNVDPEFSTKLFSIPKIVFLLDNALSSYDEKEKEYVYSFVINGAYSLIISWANNNFDLTTAKIANLTLSLANKATS